MNAQFLEVVRDFADQISAGENPLKSVITPINGATLKPYSGFNRIALAIGVKKRFVSEAFLTFNQAKTLGGSVRSGEKSTRAFFFSKIYTFAKDGVEKTISAGSSAEAEEKIGDGWTLIRSHPFVNGFALFNVEQCDGLDLNIPANNTYKGRFSDLLGNCGIEIVSGSGAPRHRDGYVVLGDLTDGLDAIALQALVGAAAYKTGASESLSYEELTLVEAIGGAFLAVALGVEPANIPEEAIPSVVEKLGKTPHVLWRAASKAQKSVDSLFASFNARKLAA
jgi:antirestriction protein ArdC